MSKHAHLFVCTCAFIPVIQIKIFIQVLKTGEEVLPFRSLPILLISTLADIKESTFHSWK